MVTKHYRLEDLRTFAIEGFTDVRPIRRVIDDAGGYVVSDAGSGATRRLIFVAPHSLHAELWAATAANADPPLVASQLSSCFKRGADAKAISFELSGAAAKEVAAVFMRASGAVQVSDVEFGWVIEHRDSRPSAPLYFTGCREKSYHGGIYTPIPAWSHYDACALRFSRRVDAEAMLPLFPETHRVAEHGWDTRPAEAAKPVG